ncbi:MAG: extensin family protein [Burkholderiaceae bacterium]
MAVASVVAAAAALAVQWRFGRRGVSRHCRNRRTGDGCGFSNAFRIDAMTLAVGPSFSLSCPAAVSLALWERHVLLPAARRHLARPIARIEHFGSYACRNRYGREGGTRSRHATADAIDIAGVMLEGGRRVTVARDWHGAGSAEDEAEMRFVREIHVGACALFDVVLGPDYNAAHADHLHLDRGRGRLCR